MQSRSADVRALKKVLLADYAEWQLLNVEKLAPYYSKEPGVVIFNDVEPVKFDGWEEFREGERKIIEGVSEWKIEPKNVRVTVWGSVGLTTATPTLSGKSKKGNAYEATLRHTAVWKKRRGRWLITHEHWSFPLPHS